MATTTHDDLSLRVVQALPAVAGVGAVAMPTLGWLLRERLSPADKVAFAVDAVGYLALIVPLRERRRTGWWLLAGMGAIQPAFSAAKFLDGTGSRGEAARRGAMTAAMLGALMPLRRHYAR